MWRYGSDPDFRALHALRVKGFATAEVVAELACLTLDEMADRLERMRHRELAAFREKRQLWQLTPAGREAHAAALDLDVGRPGVKEGLALPYQAFRQLDSAFKALCGDWQLRDGVLNDHRDPDYDRGVIVRLVEHNRSVRPVVAELGHVLERFEPYGARLATACGHITAGAIERFTGVMCGSYHDIWMELHEDLILSQGLDRVEEGSL